MQQPDFSNVIPLPDAHIRRARERERLKEVLARYAVENVLIRGAILIDGNYAIIEARELFEYVKHNKPQLLNLPQEESLHDSPEFIATYIKLCAETFDRYLHREAIQTERNKMVDHPHLEPPYDQPQFRENRTAQGKKWLMSSPISGEAIFVSANLREGDVSYVLGKADEFSSSEKEALTNDIIVNGSYDISYWGYDQRKRQAMHKTYRAGLQLDVAKSFSPNVLEGFRYVHPGNMGGSKIAVREEKQVDALIIECISEMRSASSDCSYLGLISEDADFALSLELANKETIYTDVLSLRYRGHNRDLAQAVGRRVAETPEELQRDEKPALSLAVLAKEVGQVQPKASEYDARLSFFKNALARFRSGRS